MLNYSEFLFRDKERLPFSLEAKIRHTERDFGRKIGHTTVKWVHRFEDRTEVKYQEKYAKVYRHTNPKGETFLFGKFYKGRSNSLMVTLAYLQNNTWFPCQN